MRLHRLKSLGCVVALTGLSAVSSVAMSQPVLSGEEAAKLADAYFLRGKALLKEGNVKGAYKEYKASWDLKKTYDIAANLGNVELELGMPRDAAEHLAFSIRNAAVSVTPDRLEKIKKLLEQAKSMVGAVVVRVNVDGAEVFVDGESVGRSPVGEELYVNPGPRTFEARLPGHEGPKQTVDITRAGSRMISLTLTPIAVAPPPSASAVSSAPPIPTAPPPPRKSLIPVGVGIGVAAAGIGLGLASVVVSGSKSGDAEAIRNDLLAKHSGSLSVCYQNGPADCARLDSAYVAAGSFRNLAIIGFATAGVATLATLTYALIPPAPVPATDGRVRAAVNVAPGAGGILIQGQF